MNNPVLQRRPEGLYCKAGNFYIDPWRPVSRAVITHAHADHARPGSRHYIAASPGAALLRHRLGAIDLQCRDYGQSFRLGDATVSLHPAGHILGSAQVRVSVDGETWLVTGDFKRDPDPTCAPFEVVACDTLITEATFALPVYRWPDTRAVAEDILQWWESNARAGRASLLCCYSLGKAQRLMAELGRLVDRPIHIHGAMLPLTEAYREAGVALPEAVAVSTMPRGHDFADAMVLAPPSATTGPWMRRFKGRVSVAFASGWMRLRGIRRRRGFDRGFVVSDHADWNGLIRTCRETGARRVLATHGESNALVRYLNETGMARAEALETAFGESED